MIAPVKPPVPQVRAVVPRYSVTGLKEVTLFFANKEDRTLVENTLKPRGFKTNCFSPPLTSHMPAVNPDAWNIIRGLPRDENGRGMALSVSQRDIDYNVLYLFLIEKELMPADILKECGIIYTNKTITQNFGRQ